MIIPNRPQTAAAVAAHYDELDAFYRDIWGEHVHHGYWATGRETPEQAVRALIDLLADQLAPTAGETLCDIGCGYGATARHLAARYGVAVTGLTLSAAQAAHAAARPQAGVTIANADWLTNTLPDASFDAAYAIESSEHMTDKQAFFTQAHRVLKPGGRLVLAAWLAADHPKSWEVRHLLEPICREGRLPGMGTEADYRALAATAGFTCLGVRDISARVSRTWRLCATRFLRRLTTRPRYAAFLLNPRNPNRIFAVTLFRLLLAYRTKAMRYCVLSYEKP